MAVHHFWELHTHTYNVANGGAALSKIHKRNLDDKQVFVLLKFQTASESFDSGKVIVTELPFASGIITTRINS